MNINCETAWLPDDSSSEGKGITVQAWTAPEGFRRWGSLISRESAYEGGKDVDPLHQPNLPPGKYSWYFLLWNNQQMQLYAVNFIPLLGSLYSRRGLAPGPFWTGAENLAHTGTRSPDRPVRSESLHRLLLRSSSECFRGVLIRYKQIHTLRT